MAVAAIGLILVVGAIGLMLYRSISGESAPPKLDVRYDLPIQNGDGYLIKFHVKNSGDETAAAVMIEGELKNGSETVETSSATLNYAPADSERSGGLYFSKNPQQFQLQIRATGYQKP